ncbi:hypothetical protein BDV26DRAFT_22329 [Aspergillus bertholletiae]|uniref:Peptidase metallopeptidase domain-containing protein n=1 Tax=Aspergillus bertholletiae TaxID=1226010 RepID=A0A5N7AZF3_9EURO|nr:hypothetical protein BDV26DRAFT_22329 [Aspergillus bertholletiae]
MTPGFGLHFWFLLSLLYASLSHAGHPAWEADSRTMTSKWIHVNPSVSYPLWDHETIRYCYNSRESKNRLAETIRAGWQLWYAAGVPETFRFVEHSKARCDRDKNNYLLVIGDEAEPSLMTSAGKTPMVPYNRPTMYIVFEEEDIHLRGLLAAHEIGHAWGLLHEHQAPLIWQFAYRATRPDSLVQFYCENVLGYRQLLREIPNTLELWSEDGPCRNMIRAQEMDFFGADILPWKMPYQSPHHLWPTDDDVDWDSIMIYQSRSFGEADERGNSKITLVRSKDLMLIPEPQTVTVLDVYGLLHLYRTRYGKFSEVFHNDPKSVWYSLFRRKVQSCPVQS